jgi:adenylate cyclase 9
MESTGKPGRVHISEATCKFLDDMYILEDGPMVEGRDQTILHTRTTVMPLYLLIQYLQVQLSMVYHSLKKKLEN